ncbi:MAG: MauE/DoxX family redox-associated membrane protein [Jatrophihabitantaceae bacterium]
MTLNSVRAWLGTAVRLVLGVVLVWASWPKLESPRGFKQAVRAFDVTPEWATKTIGYGLPVLELVLGVLLVAGLAVRLVSAVAAVAFLVFAVGLIQAAARGLDLSPGWFGVGGASTSTHYLLAIIGALILLAGAVFLFLWPATRISIDEYLGRHDHVEVPSPKRMRSEQGRRKYETAVQSAARAATIRSRYLNSSLAIIGVMIVVASVGVQAGRSKITGTVTATNATMSTGVVYGKKAAATVEIYEDYLCPGCAAFANAVDATLDTDVKANLAQAQYHPIAILDHSAENNGYSTRAANAALCASNVSVDFFVKYRAVLFGTDKSGAKVQPSSSSARTDLDFNRYATEIGGMTSDQTTAFRDCVQLMSNKPLIEGLTEKAGLRGVLLPPVVYVNGARLDKPDLASLTAAIAKADANGPSPQPSPTPKPSPTVTSPVSPSPTVPPSPTG